MLLNIWETIRDFFLNLFKSVSWGSVFTLITGMVIGILICLMVYLIALLKNVQSIKNKNTFNSKDIQSNNLGISEEDEILLIKKFIEASKNQFIDETNDVAFNEKLNLCKDVCIDLAVDIAKIYYPDSQHPLCELSIDEIIKLDYYIMERIEKIFEGRILKLFKKVKISFIMNLLDKKKMIDDSKIVKAAKKLNVGGVGTVIKSALNVVNPVYWIKKTSTKLTIDLGINQLFNIAIGIVGEETAKIYSKKAFQVSNEQELLIEEIIKDEIKEKE